MKTRDLEGIRRELLLERERALELLRRNTEYAMADVDDSTQDAGDIASASHDRGVLYRLQESTAKRLKLINDVLERPCEECGAEIGRVRLHAIPWAVSCLACQEEADLKALMAGAA
jgi:RNA polymerase-binding transcription factor DksA